METKEIDNFLETIYNDDVEGFKKFLESGVDVNYKTKYGTALEITNNHNCNKIFNLLLNHPNLKIDDDTDFLLLHFSCERKDVEAVKLLLHKFNIDPNIEGYDGRVPLHRACKQNNIEVVKLLLAHPKIDINAKDIHKCTPLYDACAYNSIESVNILLEQPDIEINKDYEEDEEDEEIKWEVSPLYIACEQGHVDVVKILLNRPEIKIKFNYSVFSDNKEIFNLLKNHLKH